MDFLDVEPEDPRLSADVFPVLAELRIDLTVEQLSSVYAQGHPGGLRFLAAYLGARCVGVAGWRIVSNSSAGRKLYVDDLVTCSVDRSSGVGAALLAELERRARSLGCTALDLDSGVQRGDAHRFYFREGFTIRSFHFSKALDS